MEQDFLSQIDELYNEGRHEEIIKMIEALPEEEKEYNILMVLAKSYYDIMDDDDTAHFEKTLKILKSISSDGEGDLVWMYLIAKTYFNLNQEEVAIEYFERISSIVEKDDDDDIPLDMSVSLFIESCREYMNKKAMRTIQSVLIHFFTNSVCKCKNIDDGDDENSVTAKDKDITIYIDIDSINKNSCSVNFRAKIRDTLTDWETFECYGKTLGDAVTQATSEFLQKIYKLF